MASATDKFPKRKTAAAEGTPAEEAQDARQAALKARYSTKKADTSTKAQKAMSKPMKKGPLA